MKNITSSSVVRIILSHAEQQCLFERVLSKDFSPSPSLSKPCALNLSQWEINNMVSDMLRKPLPEAGTPERSIFDRVMPYASDSAKTKCQKLFKDYKIAARKRIRKAASK